MATTENEPLPGEEAPVRAHGAAPAELGGLNLPRWKGWAGLALLVFGTTLGVYATVVTVLLWSFWRGHYLLLLMNVAMWVAATSLFAAGGFLATANSRARTRAAKETLGSL